MGRGRERRLARDSPTTPVGVIGRRGRAYVDGRGLVTPAPRGWSVDWRVGADDRWHVPAREASARQRLLEGGPVVETAIRVPRGDIVHRTYGIPGPDGGVVCVIEVENQTPTPVALALSVRADNPEGEAAVGSISRHDRVVSVDGRPALLLPRSPAQEAGLAQDAFLFPVAHRTTLRFAVAVGDSSLPETVTGLPDAAAVARGWHAQSDRGMRLTLPPGRLAEAVEANRRYLLLLDRGDLDRRTAAAVGAALDQYGFDAEADEVAPARRRRRVPQTPASLERLDQLLDSASPTFTWSDLDGLTGAIFLRVVRDLLVRETASGVALFPAFPRAWDGQPVEIHDAPTRHGLVSFALRWHGDRPALLWERTPSEKSGPVEITTRGLDPTWTTTELRGEALLSSRPASVGAVP